MVLIPNQLPYHSTRSSDYHWFQWLVMVTYICEFLRGKESNGDSESLATPLSRNTVAILWRFLQKSYKHKKLVIRTFLSWSFPLFSANVKKRVSIGAKGSVFRRLLHNPRTIRQKYPNREKHHWVSKLIILGRVWTKVCLWDKGRWCLEVFHEYFEYFLFVKHQIVLIDEEDDMEVIFATTSKAEEGEAPNIINKDQDTERASWLEGNIKNLPLVCTSGRTID